MFSFNLANLSIWFQNVKEKKKRKTILPNRMADRYYLTKQLTMKAITLPSSPTVINKRLPDEYYQLTKNFNKSSRYNNSIYWVASERDWRWLIVYELLWTPVLGLDITRANQWQPEGEREREFCKNKKRFAMRQLEQWETKSPYFAPSQILSIIIIEFQSFFLRFVVFSSDSSSLMQLPNLRKWAHEQVST